MLSDIDIAKSAKMRPILEIAQEIGLSGDELELYGTYKAKLLLSSLTARSATNDGKLILVTTISPTPFGEGKTTTTIGLAQALAKIGKRSVVCIREPSLGPTMGLKGGAAGGGYSQVLPMEDINLHFTGDMYMVGATHNLLASMTDNHLYFGNKLGLDKDNITWNRVVDMNDRALRDITIKYKGTERISGFDITAASEVMAIMCLSMNISDLRDHLGKIIVGYSTAGNPVTAKDLKADGAMALLLKEAIKPNLVQTIEGVPAFVHGGPFANIAHGCNSMIATKTALKLSDFVVTEAGFGSDLGAEKFIDIKCRLGGLKPSAIVIVVTTKALKWQGGISKEDWKKKNIGALKEGLKNFERHIKGLQIYGIPVVAAINKYEFDDTEELDIIGKMSEEMDVPSFISDVHNKGGDGGVELADAVVKASEMSSTLHYSYDLSMDTADKIENICTRIYGAKSVRFSNEALADLERVRKYGYAGLPVCMAKTQFSFSDDPKKLNSPQDFEILVKRLRIAAGAGFIVVYAGDIMTMPGLPEHPAAENMTIGDDGQIHGIF